MGKKKDLYDDLIIKYPDLTNTELAVKYLELYNDGSNKDTVRKEISKRRIKLGIDNPNTTNRSSSNSFNSPNAAGSKTFGKESVQWDEKNSTANVNIEVADTTIKNLEEALAFSKVDLDIWEVERHIFNSWTTSAIDRDSGAWKQINNIQVKIWFKRKNELGELSIDEQRTKFFEELANYAPNYAKIEKKHKTDVDKECLLELSLFDLHIGKFAWDEESSENYDTKEAISRFNKAVDSLLNRVDLTQVGKILLPIGNDMINIDNAFNMSTHAGTLQSCDSRWQQMFRKAKELLVYNIDRLSQIAPVEVIVVPGNHDTQTMFYLGEALHAWYRTSKNVNIDNSPVHRKYVEHGTNLLMFTHGNEEKHRDLGIIMATENPLGWSRTKHREAHLGHFHKSKAVSYVSVDEHQGFKVRILPSLSGTDAWHFKKGYMSTKAAEAYLYHKEEGLIVTTRYNL